MDPESLSQFRHLVSRLLETDNNVRREAEQYYNETKSSFPAQLLLSLLQLATGHEERIEARLLCCVMLRQELAYVTTEDWVWPNISFEVQQHIKEALKLAILQEGNPVCFLAPAFDQDSILCCYFLLCILPFG